MNRTINRALIVGIVLLLCAVSLYIWYHTQQLSLCGNLSCVRFPESQSYHLSDIYTDTPTTYRGLYASGNKFIRIEAVKSDAMTAKEDLDASVMRMQAMFEKAPAPYPGDISDSVVCDPAFIPSYRTAKIADGTPVQYFIGFLNNRMIFGSCSKDQAVYRGVMMFLYCKNTSLSIRLEFIAPTNEFTSNESALLRQVMNMRCDGS